MATDVLGAVIERIEGKPFAHVLHERVFGPLGMVDTGFKVPADQQHRLTDAYAFHPKDKMQPFDGGDRSRWAKDRSFHRSEASRVGKEWVRTCRSRWWPHH